MKYARVVNGYVWEVFTPWFPGVDDIKEYFPANVAAQFIPCPEEVGPAWLYNATTGVFTAPHLDPLPEPEPDPEPDPEEPSEGQDPVAVEPAGKA